MIPGRMAVRDQQQLEPTILAVQSSLRNFVNTGDEYRETVELANSVLLRIKKTCTESGPQHLSCQQPAAGASYYRPGGGAKSKP